MPEATATQPPPAPAAEPAPSSGLSLPRAVTAPIEGALSTVGSLASGATGWVGARGSRAASRARPWLEFADLSAFGLAEGGFKGYVERVKINAPYFLFNYVMLGLALTIFSVITKPIALVGAVILVWIYFQFFGSEHADEEYEFMGFSLDTTEKVGCLVFLGFIIFWFTAGGFGIFVSVLTAVAFVTALHGSFRKPSPDAIPPV